MIRLAVIGAGVIAWRAYLPALRQLEDLFRVVAVWSRKQERAQALATELDCGNAVTNLAVVLEDDRVDACAVLVPIPVMADVVDLALHAGKHVVSEKPIASSVLRALQSTDAHARRDGVVWMVAENYRYEQRYRRAAGLIRSGELGQPIVTDVAAQIAMRPGNPYYETAWRRSREVPGGLLLDIGVHYAAVLRLIHGEVKSVSAETTSVYSDLPPADTIAATLRFDSDALATLALTVAGSEPRTESLRLTGTQGSIRIHESSIEIMRGADLEIEPVEDHTGTRESLRAFARAVMSGHPHHNTPDEALRDLALIEALLASARIGERVQPLVASGVSHCDVTRPS